MILGYRSYENQSSLLTHTPTIQRQTKEEPKNNREPKRDRRSYSSSHCRTTRSSTFDGAPETGGWVAEKYAPNPNPKNRKQNQNRTDQPPRPIDLWCVWGEFPKCATRIWMGKSLWARGEVLFEWGNIWVVLEIWADFLISLFGIIWYSMVWCGMVWFAWVPSHYIYYNESSLKNNRNLIILINKSMQHGFFNWVMMNLHNTPRALQNT